MPPNEDELNALAWELMDVEGYSLAAALDEAATIYANLQAYARGYDAGTRAAVIAAYTHAALALAGTPTARAPLAN